MCRTLRPFSSLVVLMFACTVATAQNAPASMRAHRNNFKHRTHVERLETQSRIQEESLTPYHQRLALRKRGRKGVRTKTGSIPVNSTPAEQLYLEMRGSSRSTRERPEAERGE